MSQLVNHIKSALPKTPFSKGPVCLVCAQSLAPRDERVRLRGGTLVHRSCATYDMRRRRTGSGRLGYPRAG